MTPDQLLNIINKYCEDNNISTDNLPDSHIHDDWLNYLIRYHGNDIVLFIQISTKSVFRIGYETMYGTISDSLYKLIYIKSLLRKEILKELI
jgi:hypothetical protein